MKKRTLIDFHHPDHEKEWEVVNDGVMGGLSAGEFIITDDSTAVFRGTVSLENYGGFASVRTHPGRYDLTGYEGLLVHVRGDGKQYRLRLRTDEPFEGVAYQASFATRQSRWVTVKVPFHLFSASFRGQVLRDAPPLDPGRIRQIGLLIADKQAGSFWLEIARIDAYSEAER